VQLQHSCKKSSTTRFYPVYCTVDMHPYKNISPHRYRMPRKTVKFVPVVPKAHVRANVCAYRKSTRETATRDCIGITGGTKSARANICTESLLRRAILKNVLGFFYRGWYVVVHPYSNFSICCQMVLVQSIKFQTANFTIFCARIIVVFWTTYIAREVFSLVC